MSDESKIPEGAHVVIQVPPMPESELLTSFRSLLAQHQKDIAMLRVQAANEAQRRRAAEDERDDLEREVATAQRERAEWEANAKRENALLVQAQQERDKAEAWRIERERDFDEARRKYTELQQRIAALEAEAQDVKRVEAWIQRGNDPVLPEHRIAGIVNGQFGAFSEYDTADHVADSLPALGRMLKEGENG